MTETNFKALVVGPNTCGGDGEFKLPYQLGDNTNAAKVSLWFGSWNEAVAFVNWFNNEQPKITLGDLMSIMKNGVDITKEIIDAAAFNAAHERQQTGGFAEAKIYLLKAEMWLDNLPRPWMNDCIYHAIQKIKEAREILDKDN